MFNFLKKVPSVPKFPLSFPEGFFQRIEDKLQYSPDFSKLEKKAFHRVFVVDDLQSSFSNASKLGIHAAKIHDALSVDKYALVRKASGQHTTAIPLSADQALDWPVAHVQGELFAIRTDQILELDKYKLNGVEFIRNRIQIAIPRKMYLKEYTAEGDYKGFKYAGVLLDGPYEAWMYLGNPQYWSLLFETALKVKVRVKKLDLDQEHSTMRFSRGDVFSPVKLFRPKNIQLEPYYRFTRLEYDDNRFKPVNISVSYPMHGMRKFRR